jgi:hypothetical protein
MATSEQCRRCSECVGQEHHFLPMPEEDDDGEWVFPCKHCDAATPADEDEDYDNG